MNRQQRSISAGGSADGKGGKNGNGSGAVIVALDFPGKRETLDFLDLFADEKLFVKIGMELFYAEGPEIVRAVKARGHRIFLDLKLHDIPNTVERAMRSLTALDADMVNVHAAGTRRMMEAALRGLTRPDGSRPLLIAVTQLTSTDETRLHEELLIPGSMEETVLHYAENSRAAGLDGVVCSPLESPSIHARCGEDFLTVTPGVRFAEDAKGDQVRVTTPARAAALGSSLIVVGRSITRAADPAAAYARCCREFSGGRR
ncbi:MAG: orotidine-5'-phosphate decarboxylase [Anaerovoracaceae bacterium]|jgi:orotidine-5'-phosphate decarboxylase